jgi:exosortase/archaeosortase family protein
MGLQNQDFINLSVVKQSLKTGHGKVVSLGMLMGLIYLPMWIWSIASFTFTGAIFPFATVAAVLVGLTQLWHERHQIMQMNASSLDRRIGHFLIWFSLALFPFFQAQMWTKALLWSLVLSAIALSSWGGNFFRRHWCPTIFILLSSYPSIFLALPRWTWNLITGPESLERFTAWASGTFLYLIGYSVTVKGIFIFLPTGGVSVEAGCTGFEMVTTILSISVITGVAFQLNWYRTLAIACLGSILALGLNLVRVSLMILAVAYWGDQSFEFWHGFWGGQIFAGLLFTIYYYLVVSLLPNTSNPQNNAVSNSSNLQ